MIERFSKKQMELLSWWCPQSRHHRSDGIICDGAVRSGKTLCMALSFFSWSMASFSGENFAICGKTIGSVQRNLLIPVRKQLEEMGFLYSEKLSKNYVELSVEGRKNRYYLFSGRDAGSASLIQGMTLAGVLFDEVALQDRSFVEQAVARCSVEGSRFWFNCNPEYPGHWFYTDWIEKRREKNLYYLHFRMEDNPSLSKAMRKRYESLYSGGFYRRFVLGEWADVQGLIYPMFSPELHVIETPPACTQFWVSCDYGTRNPCSMGLWGESGGRWYRIKEYYYDSRKEGRCRTDEEHYAALEKLCGGREPVCVIVDPSAASFIECIRRHGKYRVVPAKNQVLEGIQKVAALLQQQRLFFCKCCTDSIREFALYRWSEGAGQEKPLKENDHAMDEIRYFVMQVCREQQGFWAIAQQRGR
nr:MAG TPA: large terminase [Caudoviricetes sp.]